MNELHALKNIKKKFLSVEPPVHNEEETLESELYASNGELIRRNEIVVRLLTKVAAVVDALDEYVIITKLLSETSPYIHMLVVGDHIRDARHNLRLAQRAKTWQKSKKKKNYLSAGVQKRYVDAFNEHINAAVMELNRDTMKRRGAYFHTIKNSIFEDLPADINSKKKFMVRKAPVLVFKNATGTIVGKKYEQVQDNLVLIHDAQLLGVNKKMRLKFAEIEKKATARAGCTVFPRPLPKVGTDIDWYLLLDFRCEITSASFVSSLQLPGQAINPGDMTGMSLEHYAWIAKRQQEQRAKIATRVQRELRETFEREEKNSFDMLRYLRNMYDVYHEAEEYWRIEFAQLTSLDGSVENGLTPDKYKLVDEVFSEYMQLCMQEYDANNATRLAILQERVEARRAYYSYLKVRDLLREIRLQMKGIRRDIEERRAAMAAQHGVTKLVEASIRDNPTLLEVQ